MGTSVPLTRSVRPQARQRYTAGFSFAVVGRGELLLLWGSRHIILISERYQPKLLAWFCPAAGPQMTDQR